MSNIIGNTNLLVENQFFAPYCQTPPDTIYVFNISNPYSYNSNGNETWPSFFKFHFHDFTVGDTDNCYVPIEGTACTVSLLDTYYKSGSTSWYQDLDEIVPKSANNNSYCKLKSNDEHSLYGYFMILFHAQEGTCYDGFYACENYKLVVYNDYGCKGNTTSINMEISRDINSDILGNVNVEYKTFSNASMVYGWTQYSPVSALVPHFHIIFDYIGAVMYSLAIVLALYCPIKSIFTFRANQKLLNHLILVYQLCFLIWSIMSMIFWATIFDSNETMSVFAEIRTLFFNIGTLLSTIVSSYLYNLVLFGKTRYELLI
ncbi:hypothetical protein HDV06_005092 [Boothiomyces sp. JEL0866]|nr:hypothetical protein HDV06_005092 [Boothiomyces sp. JEL0866]